jgi:L-fuculose-phosphate aldolase
MSIIEQYRRLQLVETARRVAEQGLARSSDGNLSIRLRDDKILITPSGAYKAALKPEAIILVDLAGNVIRPQSDKKPSTELSMHLAVYRHRADVEAVIHAHPPYATALTIAGLPFPGELVPEAVVALGEVPVVPYATPGSPQLGEQLIPFLPHHDTLLLDHHGSLCLGKTLEDALLKLERLEAVAQLYYLASGMGKIVPIPPEELDRLREIGSRYRAERQGS